MILYRWRGDAANFGDELNTILWPRLLPDFFDDDSTTRFLGIGSVLDSRHPRSVVKLVAGSGYGGYEPRARLDRNWVIHWVRGPRTAASLGLPPELALGDPAVLVPSALAISSAATVPAKPAAGRAPIGFMPHFESIARGHWTQAAALADITLIDPRDPPAAVLDTIGRCRLLLSEALHGIIVADALRVPWVAVRPLAAIHRPKWLDWADTMDLTIRWHGLPPTSVREWLATGPVAARHHGRQWLIRNPGRLDGMGAEWLTARAARALRQAAAAEPQLSAPATLDRCQSRMLQAVARLRRQPLRDATGLGTPLARRSGLHPREDSAYQLRAIG